MFFRIFRGRKDEKSSRAASPAAPLTCSSPENQDDGGAASELIAAVEPERQPVPAARTGRDSLSLLRSVSKGQRVRPQGQDHWFCKPGEAKSGDARIEMPKAREDSAPECPSIPEAERNKAIEELLSMGVEHFSVKRDKK
ncbi:MAG: hypothetical protein K2W95_19265 [Candidatus Obscuribacterales bacterium]|nr:hypothetical protein [Candidatus Obscuribacterales bacterium]